MEAGRGPRSVALDIVGRINRATGRREGGLIGNSERDIRAIQAALDELRSGDAAAMQSYLDRGLRDRRFDPIVRRAIREGKPVGAEQARKITGRMADIALRKRGETIARTELLQSLHASQAEGIQQMIDNGQLNVEQVTFEWDAANDSDTRDSHRAMDGQVRPHGQPFVSGAGNQLLFPGDRSHGAPASEIINCRCRLSPVIDFIAGLGPDD